MGKTPLSSLIPCWLSKAREFKNKLCISTPEDPSLELAQESTGLLHATRDLATTRDTTIAQSKVLLTQSRDDIMGVCWSMGFPVTQNFPFGCQVIASGLALCLQLTLVPKGYQLSCDTRRDVTLQRQGRNLPVSRFFLMAIYGKGWDLVILLKYCKNVICELVYVVSGRQYFLLSLIFKEK